LTAVAIGRGRDAVDAGMSVFRPQPTKNRG
jgi:hypothetical protein